MSCCETNRNQQKKNADWGSWALIVFLFAIGLWPVALIVLFSKLFGNDSKRNRQTGTPPLQTDTQIPYRPDDSRTTQTADTVRQETQNVVRQVKWDARYAARQVRQEARNAARQVRDEYRQTDRQENRAEKAAHKVTRSPALKSSNARWLKIIGLILAVAGAYMAFDPAEMLTFPSTMDNYYLWEALKYAAMAVGGVAMFCSGISMDRSMKRYARYLAVIGNLEAISLEQLSRKLGYSEKQVAKDLQKMIEKGYFGGQAFLNMELGWFFRSGQADADFEQQKKAAEEQTPKEAEEGYSGILRDIRRANDRIADPVLSQKIDRLEEITAKIFRAVEEDPKKRGRIDTFLNYYLPTTQKLLDSYAEFEATGIEGENLRQAKARIQKTMDSIVAGFEHQLDELYKADAMDVDSDIRVMETMLNRDTASVERDFGLGVTPATDFGTSAQPEVPTLHFDGTDSDFAPAPSADLGLGKAPAAPDVSDLELGGMMAQQQNKKS